MDFGVAQVATKSESRTLNVERCFSKGQANGGRQVFRPSNPSCIAHNGTNGVASLHSTIHRPRGRVSIGATALGVKPGEIGCCARVAEVTREACSRFRRACADAAFPLCLRCFETCRYPDTQSIHVVNGATDGPEFNGTPHAPASPRQALQIP